MYLCTSARAMAEADRRRGADGAIAMWASCSAAQIVGAFLLYSRGYRASTMPARAFFIASLGLGAAVSATAAALHSSGISRVFPSFFSCFVRLFMDEYMFA